ncbi:hypothetical protein [Ferrovibrio xuzhouensis]|uniref:Type I restriction modification DNA specificity domain-containing protein n=1 Tax=Ferrovibrio xuzhouensis TaxID=1576914 RepID=A0ABV7VCE2_9PROT
MKTGWNAKPLGEVCAIIGGGTPPIPPISQQRRIVDLLDSGFHEIDVIERDAEGNVQNSKLLFQMCLSEVFGRHHSNWETCEVMTDLSSKMKLLGRPAFIDRDNVLHNQRIGRVIFHSEKVDKHYLYFYMLSEAFLSNIRRTATGTMVRHTAPKRIVGNRISFPSDHQSQRNIIGKLVAIRSECSSLQNVYQRKLAALDELKKSLLHQAFTGNL